MISHIAPQTPRAANTIRTIPATIRKEGRAAQLRLVMYRYLLEAYWAREERITAVIGQTINWATNGFSFFSKFGKKWILSRQIVTLSPESKLSAESLLGKSKENYSCHLSDYRLGDQ